MGRSLLVAEHLQRGALIAPFPGFATAPGLGYWAVLPGRGAGKSAATMFADWLRHEITGAADR